MRALTSTAENPYYRKLSWSFLIGCRFCLPFFNNAGIDWVVWSSLVWKTGLKARLAPVCSIKPRQQWVQFNFYLFCPQRMAQTSQSQHDHNGLFLSSPFWPAVLCRLQILMRPLWRTWNPQVSPCLTMQKTGCFVDTVRPRGRRNPPPAPFFFFPLNIVFLFFWNFPYFLCFLPGHCLHEIFALREGKVGRVPDMVVWPSECISCVIPMFLLVCFSPPTQHQWSPPPGLGDLKG